jgi:hypothetical protein
MAKNETGVAQSQRRRIWDKTTTNLQHRNYFLRSAAKLGTELFRSAVNIVSTKRRYPREVGTRPAEVWGLAMRPSTLKLDMTLRMVEQYVTERRASKRVTYRSQLINPLNH